MSYEKTIHFDGNIGKALEVAINVFLPHGFTITKKTDEFIELTGPGTLWTQGQDSLIGISKVSVSGTNNELSIKAEFGGIWKTIKYLVIFIIGMSIFFLVFFGIMFNKQGVSTHKFLLSLAPFIPWPVVIPLMAIWMKSRTSHSLDALLNNMATLGKHNI